jgi:transcriptional regulator with GAF, ATPase, and Fis domain
LARWDVVDGIVRSALVRENLVGASQAWTLAVRRVVELAAFTDANVLLTGESGTGKELIARLLHTLDRREDKKDLVVLDCTTVVPELAGSEFFGHERGAFTGAVSARDGAFALADQGTLFLDEVGELPRELQPQLLRVIQEGTYKRVGGNSWHKTRFRLVSATNRDLPQGVARGEFRSDLYYRVATCTVALPPLKDRVEDILPLARHFMKQAVPEGDVPDLDPAVRDFLMSRDYPGNVRDLRQLVTRIMHRHVPPGPVTVGDIPEEDRPRGAGVPRAWCDGPFEQAIRKAVAADVGLKEIGRIAQDTAVRIAVAGEEGNLQRAAEKLKVTDRALQMRQQNGRPRTSRN